MKEISIIFAVYFLLVGCTSKVIITPDNLPNAIVGQPYYVKIEIKGGSGPVSYIDSVITPDVLVVQSNPNKSLNDNQFIIVGKPVSTETIIVKIRGGMISTGWKATSDFEKTYVIKVKEAE